MKRSTILMGIMILSLGGCEWIDDLGRHMPVVGERCENWECFTSSGQAQSEATKRALAQREGGEKKRTPINAQGTSGVSQQGTPSTPTPFDMNPEELNSLPQPSVP